MYTIHLHQSTGETQFLWDSDSYDAITKLWDEECSSLDEYTEFDEYLTLSNELGVINTHMLTDEQRSN